MDASSNALLIWLLPSSENRFSSACFDPNNTPSWVIREKEEGREKMNLLIFLYYEIFFLNSSISTAYLFDAR